MWTVKQVSDIAGVSVRTLHHYDAIGLLKPAKVTEAGYRLYDEGALGRLQSILLFRELGFPLQEIKSILDHPGFDPHGRPGPAASAAGEEAPACGGADFPGPWNFGKRSMEHGFPSV